MTRLNFVPWLIPGAFPPMFVFARLRSSPSRAKDAVDVCLEVFLDDRDHYPEARRSVIDRVCVPFLLHCSIQALKDVFTCHIREIMSIVEGKLVKVCFMLLLFMSWFWTVLERSKDWVQVTIGKNSGIFVAYIATSLLDNPLRRLTRAQNFFFHFSSSELQSGAS